MSPGTVSSPYDRSEGGLPARNGLCHSCTCVRVAGVVLLLGSDRRVGFVFLFLSLARRLLGSAFFEVRFRGRGPLGNVLLSEIYALACSGGAQPHFYCYLLGFEPVGAQK